MFYSVDLLRFRKHGKGRFRKNRKGQLPACWLAATIKEFVGTGGHKLSKADIESVHVEAVCDDIVGGLVGNEASNRFSLYLSSQLTFGAIKIFQQQINYLGDDCEQFYKNIMTNLIASKEKNLRKKRVDENTSFLEDIVVDAVDLTCLFPENQVDKHLIQDEIPVVFETGLEFHDVINYIDNIRGFPSINTPSFQEAFYNNTEEVLNQTDFINEEKITDSSLQNISVIRTPVAPKQKHGETQDETPRKRMRKSSNPSELARSPVTWYEVRRSIFKDQQNSLKMNADLATSGCIPMDEDTAVSSSAVELELIGQSKNAARYSPPIRNTEGVLPQLYESIDESLAPPQISDESLLVSKTSDESLGLLKINESTPIAQDTEMAYLPQVLLPVQNSRMDNGLRNERQREIAQRNVQDELDLYELDATLLNALENERRPKNKQVFDHIKQINLKEPKTNLHYTRSMITTQPKVKNKILAKHLLILPASGLKIGTHLNKNLCSWGNNLQNLFFKMIESSCNVIGTYREPQPRDTNLNRSTRFSEFARVSFSRPSTSHTSSKSAINLTNGQNKDYESTNQDMILMPPPLPVPEPPLELQMDEQEEKVEQNLTCSSKNRSTSDPSEFNMVVSMEQVNENTDDFKEAKSASRRGGFAGSHLLPDSDESFLPKPHSSESSNTASSSSIEHGYGGDLWIRDRLSHRGSAFPGCVGGVFHDRLKENFATSNESESQHENLIITIEEFDVLLEEMWSVAENFLVNEEKRLQFELDDILTPEETSIEELIKYFLYCCELERKFKLSLKQKISYGPVYIIKQ